MQLDQLRKLFEEEKDFSVLRWPGKCHDCGKEVEVEAFMEPGVTNDIGITGGAVYWPQWHHEAGEKIFYVKCDECFEKNPTLTNAREIEVYSRIVGYLRPIKQWNIGKRAEFENRKLFKVG